MAITSIAAHWPGLRHPSIAPFRFCSMFLCWGLRRPQSLTEKTLNIASPSWAGSASKIGVDDDLEGLHLTACEPNAVTDRYAGDPCADCPYVMNLMSRIARAARSP